MQNTSLLTWAAVIALRAGCTGTASAQEAPVGRKAGIDPHEAIRIGRERQRVSAEIEDAARTGRIDVLRDNMRKSSTWMLKVVRAMTEARVPLEKQTEVWRACLANDRTWDTIRDQDDVPFLHNERTLFYSQMRAPMARFFEAALGEKVDPTDLSPARRAALVARIDKEIFGQPGGVRFAGAPASAAGSQSPHSASTSSAEGSGADASLASKIDRLEARTWTISAAVALLLAATVAAWWWRKKNSRSVKGPGTS